MLRLQSLCSRPSVRIAVSEIRPVIGLLPSLLSSVGRGLSSSSSSSSDPEGDKLRAAVLQQRRINAENKAAQEAAYLRSKRAAEVERVVALHRSFLQFLPALPGLSPYARQKERARERQVHNRRYTYFGTADNKGSLYYLGPHALEESRREEKLRADRAVIAKQAAREKARAQAAIAKQQAKEEQERQNEELEKPLKEAVEQQLQLHLRQTPLAAAQAFVPGVDERRFRESLSDEQVTVIALLTTELEAVDGLRFSPWKQHRIALRDPLTKIKEAAAPPTTGPRLTNKPGLFELAVKTKEGRLIALYLGFTTDSIRDRLSSAGFVPIESWIRELEPDQLEQMIYVRELVIEPPPQPPTEQVATPSADKEAIAIANAEKKRLSQTFRAQLLERKERLLDQLNYFVNPYGQLAQCELRFLDHRLTEDTLREMHAAFIEFAQWSVEDRSTSKGRATLLGESGEPEPVDLDSPDDTETKQ